MIRKIRYYIFLRDVLTITLMAFGGPQAHLALMIKRFVNKRAYLTEQELIELNALCNLLPGPTSTQTITAIGFKIGGPNLAYLTLLTWITPAVTIMTAFGVLVSYAGEMDLPLNFTKYIQPMAVGFVAYAATVISGKVVKSYEGMMIMLISAFLSYLLKSPFVFPVLLISSGVITAFKFDEQPKEKAERKALKINWSNFFLWGSILIGVAVIGHFTGSVWVKLFENFYRNGSLIFGGGQVLVPLMYTEFVEFKKYLTSEEFLTGYAAVQALPGPTFSFVAYIGTLSMREFGIAGEIAGGFLASIAIFLPGTFYIFFAIRFWDSLKKYRIVRAAMEGVSAASAGMVIAAAFLLFEPVDNTFINYFILISTYLLLTFTKVPPPFIIIAGLLAGIFL